MTNITIDELKFSKTSKKLLTNLNNEHNLKLKLSQVQETLAKSLGFRNLHSLKNEFSNETPILKIQKNTYTDIFKDLEAEQIVKAITCLMPYDNSMWKVRAITLLTIVIESLVYLSKQKKLNLNIIKLDIDTISEYLILDNIIKLSKDNAEKNSNELSTELKSKLKSYLTSLPGYKESSTIQSSTTIEQHGYLQMQFTSVLFKIKQIESNDFIIADKDWFDGWKDELNNPHVVLNSKLKKMEFIEDSWLVTNEFSEFLYSMKNKKNPIKISNLLNYVTTIISSNKYNKMHLLLLSLLDNYSIASKISIKITETIESTTPLN